MNDKDLLILAHSDQINTWFRDALKYVTLNDLSVLMHEISESGITDDLTKASELSVNTRGFVEMLIRLGIVNMFEIEREIRGES